ncbi:hypothetical protein HTZ84_02160 [Haloterrigena sp. SYSU A558-1]|uniref:Uncharacterized protein n=1 Tax=Haloterrigena gelatinilytica TaxID=2741724 RepID=A0ABX2L4C2_9EURY|nr:hypothetical protein [Haloterrigena gelatinilytica]NUC71124.1 hypothetical protein [Haloterrigena gelatinilytica]
MTTSSGRKAVVACTGCSAIPGADDARGRIVRAARPEDDCVCGASTFRRLR